MKDGSSNEKGMLDERIPTKHLFKKDNHMNLEALLSLVLHFLKLIKNGTY